jgi:hypothetical protein
MNSASMNAICCLTELAKQKYSHFRILALRGYSLSFNHDKSQKFPPLSFPLSETSEGIIFDTVRGAFILHSGAFWASRPLPPEAARAAIRRRPRETYVDPGTGSSDPGRSTQTKHDDVF